MDTPQSQSPPISPTPTSVPSPSANYVFASAGDVPVTPRSDVAPIPEEIEIPVGFSENPSGKQRHVILASLFGVIVLLGLLVWGAGQLQRQGKLTWLDVFSSQRPSFEIIETRNGQVLIQENTGNTNRIIVKQIGQNSWFLVSQDDQTATQPVFSPDGSWVAFLSKRDGGRIVITAVITDTQKLFTTEMIKKSGVQASLGELELCPWTPIAWNPKGNRVAFFGCSLSRPFSIVLIGEVSNNPLDPIALIGTGLDTNDSRGLTWADTAHLVITNASVGSTPASVTTILVP